MYVAFARKLYVVKSFVIFLNTRRKDDFALISVAIVFPIFLRYLCLKARCRPSNMSEEYFPILWCVMNFINGVLESNDSHELTDVADEISEKVVGYEFGLLSLSE